MKQRGKQYFDAVAAMFALVATIIIALVVWGLFAFLLSGCTTTKYMPVETIKTEYKDKVQEIHTTDSVVDVRFVYINGDTVRDYRDRVKWRDRYIHDSVFIENNDTIREPYPVERELSRWQQAKMDFGGMAIGAVAVMLCFAVVWLIKRFKR